jgi:ribonuclease HI
LGKLHDKELALAVMALYQLWLARNETRDGTPITDPLDVARRTIFLVEEWAGLKPIQVPKLAQPNAIWQAPAEGWHKVNADGAFSSESGNGGCGVVLRDHHGQFLAGASHFLTFVADPEGAEVEAYKRALVLARNLGVAKVCLETDSLSVVSKLRSRELDRSLYGPVLEEIKALLSGFEDHSVRHVRRSGNGVAHCLAKLGCSNNICNSWLGSPPGCIVTLLASECA